VNCKNASIILNGLENKAKYGTGYGYGNYANGYYEEEIQKWYQKIGENPKETN
jgi:hypothetical protein